MDERNDKTQDDSLQDAEKKFVDLCEKIRNKQPCALSKKSLFGAAEPQKIHLRPSMIDRACLKSTVVSSTPNPNNKDKQFIGDNSAVVSPIEEVNALEPLKGIAPVLQFSVGSDKSVITVSSTDAVRDNNKVPNGINPETSTKRENLNNLVRKLSAGVQAETLNTTSKTVQTSANSLNNARPKSALRKLARSRCFQTGKERETQTGISLDRNALFEEGSSSSSSHSSDASEMSHEYLKPLDVRWATNSYKRRAHGLNSEDKRKPCDEGPWRLSCGFNADNLPPAQPLVAITDSLEESLDDTFLPKQPKPPRVFMNKKKANNILKKHTKGTQAVVVSKKVSNERMVEDIVSQEDSRRKQVDETFNKMIVKEMTEVNGTLSETSTSSNEEQHTTNSIGNNKAEKAAKKNVGETFDSEEQDEKSKKSNRSKVPTSHKKQTQAKRFFSCDSTQDDIEEVNQGDVGIEIDGMVKSTSGNTEVGFKKKQEKKGEGSGKAIKNKKTQKNESPVRNENNRRNILSDRDYDAVSSNIEDIGETSDTLNMEQGKKSKKNNDFKVPVVILKRSRNLGASSKKERQQKQEKGSGKTSQNKKKQVNKSSVRNENSTRNISSSDTLQGRDDDTLSSNLENVGDTSMTSNIISEKRDKKSNKNNQSMVNIVNKKQGSAKRLFSDGSVQNVTINTSNLHNTRSKTKLAQENVTFTEGQNTSDLASNTQNTSDSVAKKNPKKQRKNHVLEQAGRRVVRKTEEGHRSPKKMPGDIEEVDQEDVRIESDSKIKSKSRNPEASLKKKQEEKKGKGSEKTLQSKKNRKNESSVRKENNRSSILSDMQDDFNQDCDAENLRRNTSVSPKKRSPLKARENIRKQGDEITECEVVRKRTSPRKVQNKQVKSNNIVANEEPCLRRSKRQCRPPPSRAVGVLLCDSEFTYKKFNLVTAIAGDINKSIVALDLKVRKNKNKSIKKPYDTIKTAKSKVASKTILPVPEEPILENVASLETGYESAPTFDETSKSKENLVLSGKITKKRNTALNKKKIQSSLVQTFNESGTEEVDYYLNIRQQDSVRLFKCVFKHPQFTEIKGLKGVTTAVTKDFPTGMLKIQPGKAKPKQVATHHQLNFGVMEGEAEFGVEDKSYIINKTEMFSVPAGCEYYIKNRSSREELLLYFTKFPKGV